MYKGKDSIFCGVLLNCVFIGAHLEMDGIFREHAATQNLTCCSESFAQQ